MTDTPAARVGRNVRAELARNDLTQGDLARHLHITQPAVSRRLAGERAFNVDELAVIARVVGVPMSRLVAGTERPQAAAECQPAAAVTL